MKSLSLILGLVILMVMSCSFHPTITTDEAYLRIKPFAQLPESERLDMPENLIIQIENVADMASSYKNKVDLYVNNFLVQPDEAYNYKSNYEYKLKLQPGIYKVKAVYYANSGWIEKGYDISTREEVKVYLDKKTYMTVELKKNWWGAPENKTFFLVRYEALTAQK
jgi:hypothetical protein